MTENEINYRIELNNLLIAKQQNDAGKDWEGTRWEETLSDTDFQREIDKVKAKIKHYDRE